jgi:hypothetical protein
MQGGGQVEMKPSGMPSGTKGEEAGVNGNACSSIKLFVDFVF